MNIGQMKTWGSVSVPFLTFLLLIAGATAQRSITTFGGCAGPISGRNLTLLCSGNDNKDPHNVNVSSTSWSTVSKTSPFTRIIALGYTVQKQWASILDINATWSPSQQKWGYDLTIKNFTSILDGIFKCELLGAVPQQLRVTAVDLNFTAVTGNYSEKWENDNLASRQLSLSGLAMNSTTDYEATYIVATDKNAQTTFIDVANATVDLCRVPYGTYDVEVCFCGTAEENSYPVGCEAAPGASFDFVCSNHLFDDYMRFLRYVGIAFAVVSLLLVIYLVVVLVCWKKEKDAVRSTWMIVIAWVVLAVVCVGFIITAAFVAIKAVKECDSCETRDYGPAAAAMTVTPGGTTIPTTPPPATTAMDPGQPGAVGGPLAFACIFLTVAVLLALAVAIFLCVVKLCCGGIAEPTPTPKPVNRPSSSVSKSDVTPGFHDNTPMSRGGRRYIEDEEDEMFTGRGHYSSRSSPPPNYGDASRLARSNQLEPLGVDEGESNKRKKKKKEKARQGDRDEGNSERFVQRRPLPPLRPNDAGSNGLARVSGMYE